MVVDDGSAAAPVPVPRVGELFTTAKDSTTVHRVTSYAAGTMVFTPGLVVALVDDDALFLEGLRYIELLYTEQAGGWPVIAGLGYGLQGEYLAVTPVLSGEGELYSRKFLGPGALWCRSAHGITETGSVQVVEV